MPITFYAAIVQLLQEVWEARSGLFADPAAATGRDELVHLVGRAVSDSQGSGRYVSVGSASPADHHSHLLDDCPQVLPLLHLAWSLTPSAAEQAHALLAITDMCMRDPPIETSEISDALRADPAMLARVWAVGRRRLEMILNVVKVSHRGSEGAQRLAVTGVVLSQLVQPIALSLHDAQPMVVLDSLRWPLSLLVDAAGLAHQFRFRVVDRAMGTTIQGVVGEGGFGFVEIGLGLLNLLISADETYAIQNVEDVVQMAAALSVMTPAATSLSALKGSDALQHDDVVLGPVLTIILPLLGLVEKSLTRPRFQAELFKSLEHVFFSTLAGHVSTAEPAAPRSERQRRVRDRWLRIAAPLRVPLPASPLRCWQSTCRTIGSASFSRCARCEMAICAPQARPAPADRADCSVSCQRAHWPTHRRICAVLKTDEARP